MRFKKKISYFFLFGPFGPFFCCGGCPKFSRTTYQYFFMKEGVVNETKIERKRVAVCTGYQQKNRSTGIQEIPLQPNRSA
jgi:hypothetical protein